MDQTNLKRSASVERQAVMDGSAREMDNRYYHRSGGRHNNEMPWERTTLYSDRERIPRGREPEPPSGYHHRGDYQPHFSVNSRYRGPPLMPVHPPPHHHEYQGRYHHGPPSMIPPVEHHLRNHGYDIYGEGFQLDVTGRIPPQYQYDHYHYRPPLRPTGRLLSSMEDVKYFPMSGPPSFVESPQPAPLLDKEIHVRSDLENTEFSSVEKEDVLPKLVPVSGYKTTSVSIITCL